METVIVLLILALAVAAGLWTFYRAIKGGCNCNQSCKSCGNSKSDTKKFFLVKKLGEPKSA